MVTVIWADWYALTFVVISIALALVALAYMAAIGFHLPKLQAWAKEEFYQALASALIAVLLMTFVSTINLITTQLYGRDPFGIAFDYVNAMAASLGTFFLQVAYVDVVYALMQSMVYHMMPSQMGFNIDPFGGMVVLTSMLSFLMEAILTGMSIMLGQGTFLLFIRAQLSIIFPIGIALRSFPFTRPAGGALIAVFFGFYIFYPFLWVFDNAIYNEISSVNYINPGFSANAEGLGSACTADVVQCTTNTPDIGLNIILSIINTLGYKAIYYLFVFAFIMSLFNLLTVLVLTNELAKVFGSEIDLGGLSGLI